MVFLACSGSSIFWAPPPQPVRQDATSPDAAVSQKGNSLRATRLAGITGPPGAPFRIWCLQGDFCQQPRRAMRECD
jgi:hypothetical protein